MKKLAILFAVLFALAFTARAQQIYAVYTENDKTATLYYDDKASQHTEGTVFLYEEDSYGGHPLWQTDVAVIVRFVLTPPMADARPTSTSRWFKRARVIEGLQYLNTSEVTDMSQMFLWCELLESLDVSHFDTGKVIRMDSMFEDCKSLTSLDLSAWDTHSVTSTREMFERCKSLTKLNLGALDMQNCTNMQAMFAGCYSLERIYVSPESKWPVISDDGRFDGFMQIFLFCEKLMGGNGTAYKETRLNSHARIDTPSTPGYFTSNEGYPKAISLDNDQLHIYDLNKTSSYLVATLGGDNISHDKITWTSSNPDVATVSAIGGICALSYGETVITATTENCHTASCRVTVEERQAVYPRSLSFTQPVFYIYAGESQKLGFELEPKYANQFSFQSTNPGIAEVSADGTVKGIQPGVCRVIVAWTDPDGISHSDVCRVEVSAR